MCHPKIQLQKNSNVNKMNSEDSEEGEDEDDRFIGGSVTSVPPPNPLLIRLLTLLSCIGGFLFGYDTGVVSGAMVLVSKHFSLTPSWHSAIVSVTVIILWPKVEILSTNHIGILNNTC